MKNAIPPSRSSASLKEALAFANDALIRRRAADIPEQTIDRLVAMRWLQWKGGSLSLTEQGEAMLVQVQAEMLGTDQPAAA